MTQTPDPAPPDPRADAPQRRPPGKPDDSELLVDGQEEVFSRTEVESGHIEHHSLEEDESLQGAKGDPAEGKR